MRNIRKSILFLQEHMRENGCSVEAGKALDLLVEEDVLTDPRNQLKDK